MNSTGIVRIGKIVKAHGLKGEAKVSTYGESFSIYENGRRFTAVSAEGIEQRLAVKRVKPGNRTAIVAFEDIDTRGQAETLIGSELFYDRDLLPELDDDTFYWADIIGMDVFTLEDEHIGKVVSIIQTGANDVYVVRNGPAETLVPALEWVVRSVNLDSGRIRVDLPEGL